MRPLLRWLLCAAVGVAMLAPASAAARVLLVAPGTPELTFVDVSSQAVIGRLALPGAARAVAISRDGQRGYVAAGSEVIAVDVNARTEVGRSTLGTRQVSDIEVSREGTLLYVVRGRQLAVLDSATLAVRSTIGLKNVGKRIAIDKGANLAAVVLRKGGVAIVSLEERRLLRRVKVKGAVGVAIDAQRNTLVSARGRLFTIRRGQRRANKRSIKLPKGAGGGLALTRGRTKLLVGAASRGRSAAVIDLRSRSVRRIPAGPGLGWPAWNADASRIYLADGGAAGLTIVSPFTRQRIGTIDLPASAPLDLLVQPGIAPIAGTEGPDRISGTRGPDAIQGFGGDDVLRGGRGNDSVDGGPGNDRVAGGLNSDSLFGGDGNDYLTGSTGDDRILAGPGDDAADGGTGNDKIDGEAGNDRLDGGDGDDIIRGGEGNDTIIEDGFGDDELLDGGPGDDTIRGGRGSDQLIVGGEGNDQLYGETGAERILGGPGNDLIDGGRAGDRLEGDAGDDRILGGPGHDRLNGASGNDHLDGGPDGDELTGEDGNDVLIGGSGPDVFSGGDGNDAIRAADDSADRVDCGPGIDTVFVENIDPTRDLLIGCEFVIAVPPEPDTGEPAPRTVRGGPGNDKLYGTSGIDSMFGRDGDDKLFAKSGDDYVDGDSGNDQLHGNDGDDTIAGRGGHDVIWGGLGADRITGDRGRDRIMGGPGNDTIFGNIDSDEIDGGSGDDRINVVHGGRDRVVCGSGRDTVFADPEDKVAKDCERVRR